MNYIKPVSIKIASFVWMRLWWDNYLFDLYMIITVCWLLNESEGIILKYIIILAMKIISHLFSNVTCECLVMDMYMLKSQLPLASFGQLPNKQMSNDSHMGVFWLGKQDRLMARNWMTGINFFNWFGFCSIN